MKTLTNKQIIVAVSGSIAAYKAPDIIRRLQDIGAQVRVILTRGGSEFITELSLQVTSKNSVHHNLWDKDAELSMGHIELAKWADAILIAPASANTISNLAAGKANDLLSSVVLASNAPLIIAPAMNQQMYSSTAVQDNLALLRDRKAQIINPDNGEQACGDIGEGRLAEPKNIAQFVANIFQNTKLSGKKVLITLGATMEPIDPVRFITNTSSGKMGSAIADACIEAGAEVTIVHGNVTTILNPKATLISARTAQRMYQAVIDNIDQQDIFIAVAAVSDYTCQDVKSNKIKKSGKNLILELTPSKDILKSVCQLDNKPLCIGFAAETQNLIENAKNKLKNKGCDAIILNDVSQTDLGFNSDQNEVIFLDQNSHTKIEKTSKQKLGRKIVKMLAKKFF